MIDGLRRHLLWLAHLSGIAEPNTKNETIPNWPMAGFLGDNICKKEATMSSANFWRPLRSLTWTDVESLLLGGAEEGTTLDFKSFGRNPIDKNGWPTRDRLSALLAAMSNTAAGRIVIGADADDQDHHVIEFRGVPLALLKSALSRVHEAAARVQPPAAIETKWVQIVAKDAWVLVIEVLPDRRAPRQVDGTYLMRVGSSNRPMPHSLVEATILASRDPEGRREADFTTPLEGADMLDSGSKNRWQFGVWIHAPHQMPHLLDSGEEDGLDPLKRAFTEAGLEGARYGLTTAGIDIPGVRRVRVDYAGAAWEIISSDFLTHDEHVPVAALSEHLESSVRRLGRILKAIGYEQHVSVKVTIRNNAGHLLLRWEDGSTRTGLWTSTQELASDLVDELIDVSCPVVEQLRRRFVTYIRRQAELNGPIRLV